MKQFGLISEIDINNPGSWENKIFITLDIDWANDDVLNFTLDLLLNLKVRATWFITHETEFNNRLRQYPDQFELGIHPNFNPILLNGSHEKGKTAIEVVENILKLVPEAKAVRSHSLTQNSTLLKNFKDLGLQFDLNTFIPIQSKIVVKPYPHWVGLTQLPHIWEDDVHCYFDSSYQEIVNAINSQKGLVILDFHPIHLFLNTEKFERYEQCKTFLSDTAALKERVNVNEGTFTFFKKIAELVNP